MWDIIFAAATIVLPSIIVAIVGKLGWTLHQSSRAGRLVIIADAILAEIVLHNPAITPLQDIEKLIKQIGDLLIAAKQTSNEKIARREASAAIARAYPDLFRKGVIR